jgi:hypothetical protein
MTLSWIFMAIKALYRISTEVLYAATSELGRTAGLRLG